MPPVFTARAARDSANLPSLVASSIVSVLLSLQVGARSLYQLIQPLTLSTSHLLVDPVSAQYQGRQPILYMGSD
jgi:hypothetical protein